MSRTTPSTRFRWRSFVAAVSAALLIGAGAAPAQADPVLIWDGSTAEFDLIVTSNEDGIYSVDVTNLTSESHHLGFGVDLRSQGVTEFLWQEQWQVFADLGEAVLGPGESYQENFLPGWSGMTYSFFTSIDSTPELIGEFVVEGRYLPFEVEADSEGNPTSIRAGYPVVAQPGTARAGEPVYITASLGADWPLTEAEVWIGENVGSDAELSIITRGVPGLTGDIDVLEGMDLLGVLPAQADAVAGALVLPSYLTEGSYRLLVGDSSTGLWPAGPTYEVLDEVVVSTITLEAGPPRGTTELGSTVTVEPLDQFGTMPVTFTFDEVTTGGTTSVTTSTSGPAPTAFTLLGGVNAVYYELETTAEFTGLVTVCLSYDPTGLSEAQQNAIALFHYTGGAWSNITTTRSPGQVCGETDSFSPFALGIPTLQYAFEGFLSPISNSGVTTALAGTVVPIRFRLGGDQGLNVIVPGSPVSGQVTCSASATATITQPTVAAAPLQYARSSQTYWYFWEAPKSWGGTCRQFVMALDDGSVHTTVVKFDKLTLRNVIKAILRAI